MPEWSILTETVTRRTLSLRLDLDGLRAHVRHTHGMFLASFSSSDCGDDVCISRAGEPRESSEALALALRRFAGLCVDVAGQLQGGDLDELLDKIESE